MKNMTINFEGAAKLMGSLIAVGLLSGCASISQDQCAAGNWSERGYKDGLRGKSSASISKYADKCSEYGFRVDSSAYLQGFQDGVVQYCTFERGLSLGEQGSSFNQVCAGGIGDGFAEGYDAGRVVYEIRQEYNGLLSHYDQTLQKLGGVKDKLALVDLDRDEVKRLRRKKSRVERELDDVRIDIRAFERIHDFPRHIF